MIIQICEKCDRFYMVHNPDSVLKKCPNCKNEDLENIYGDDAHIWYLEGKLKVVGGQLALTEKALELACEEYSKLYCEHYCHREPCDECENGDYEFFKDKFLETAKEIMKSE